MIKRLIFAELAKKTSASYGTRMCIKIQNSSPLEAVPEQTTQVRILTTCFSITHLNIMLTKISRYFKLSFSFASFD
jgi:hypothetical protein